MMLYVGGFTSLRFGDAEFFGSMVPGRAPESIMRYIWTGSSSLMNESNLLVCSAKVQREGVRVLQVKKRMVMWTVF